MSSTDWVGICHRDELGGDAGICALVNGEQVAVFYVRRTEELYAVANFDPIGRANVMARGIIGSLGERTVVASPLYKQHFDLTSGECIEQPEHQLEVYDVRLASEQVQVRSRK